MDRVLEWDTVALRRVRSGQGLVLVIDRPRFELREGVRRVLLVHKVREPVLVLRILRIS